LGWSALNDTPLHSHHTLADVLFDHLGDVNGIPRSQARPSWLTIVYGFSEDLLNGPDVHLASVDTEQQRTTPGTVTYFLDQCDDQLLIPRCIERISQPKPCLNLDRHSRPKNTTLNLGTDFVCLHLTQIAWQNQIVPKDPFLSNYSLNHD
jgi:hypothetical protein